MLNWSGHVYYFYLMTYSIRKIPSCEAKGQNSVNMFAARGTRWLGGCPGRSVSSLGTHVILLVLSFCGSIWRTWLYTGNWEMEQSKIWKIRSPKKLLYLSLNLNVGFNIIQQSVLKLQTEWQCRPWWSFMSSLIWVYTVCPGLCVTKLRLITT